MTPADRDREIVNLVARFGQLTSNHIFQLLFHGHKSRTQCDRRLKRLVDDGQLARIERRLVGGSRGGSGQYVYQVGPDAWRDIFDGRYRPMRTIRHHSLAIADCYATLVDLERHGRLSIGGWSAEPDCHMTIGKYDLRPDLYVEIARPGGESVPVWLEIDMGSEGQRQLREKFARYFEASKIADAERLPVWPLVIWVAVDDKRREELRWLLMRVKSEHRAMFRLTTIAELGVTLY